MSGEGSDAAASLLTECRPHCYASYSLSTNFSLLIPYRHQCSCLLLFESAAEVGGDGEHPCTLYSLFTFVRDLPSIPQDTTLDALCKTIVSRTLPEMVIAGGYSAVML